MNDVPFTEYSRSPIFNRYPSTPMLSVPGIQLIVTSLPFTDDDGSKLSTGASVSPTMKTFSSDHLLRLPPSRSIACTEQV